MINVIQNTDALLGLKKLETESVDVIIVDPPYNINKDFGATKYSYSLEEYIKWCLQWYNECYRVLKKTGTGFIYGFPEIIQHLGVKIPIDKQKWLTWHYTNKTIPSLKFWQRSSETIISFWKNKENRIFNLDDVREEYTESFLNNAAGKKRKNTKGRFGNKKDTIYNANEKGAMPRDVLKIPALAGGAGKKERDDYCKTCDVLVNNKEDHIGHEIITHPTQKPMALTEKLIKSSMNKEKTNTILIPFAGTGSEAIVARKLECNFIAFENNEDYIRLAEERLKKYGFK